jgi:transcriptional regulator with XRE-family HTH domain
MASKESILLTSGEKIRRLREDMMWGQAELARKAGITATQLWRIEAGITRNPRPATLRAIADALGIPHTQLRGDAAVTESGAAD